MDLRRSERARKPRTIWEQKGAPSTASDPKISQESARTAEKTALKPVATGTLPPQVALERNDLPDLPDYTPPLELCFEHSKPLISPITELETFQHFLTHEIIAIIVRNTNSYAENTRKFETDLYTRPWTPVNSTDIWRYCGTLLYMGAHIERKREEYWTKSTQIATVFSIRRWEQIHRYFTLRDRTNSPR
jgi:Transposase IS4